MKRVIRISIYTICILLVYLKFTDLADVFQQYAGENGGLFKMYPTIGLKVVFRFIVEVLFIALVCVGIDLSIAEKQLK